jgi:hypothetical protein
MPYSVLVLCNSVWFLLLVGVLECDQV